MRRVQRATRKPPPSPEHEALVAAITRHRGRLRELDDLRAAERKAWDQAEDAKRTIAEAVHAEAKAEDAELQAMVAGGEATVLVRPRSQRALEQARTKAKVADKACAVLREKIRSLESGLSFSEMNIDAACAKFLATNDQVQKLLDKRAALHVKLGDLDHALSEIWDAGGLPEFTSWFDMSNSGPPGELTKRWREAIAALHEDADARLPD